MDDVARVRGVERHRNLHAEVDDLIDRQRASLDALLHRPALEQLHHDEGPPLVLAELVDRTDVWVFQRRRQPGFALEPGQPRRVGAVFLAEELDRDLAIEAQILRAVYDAHATFAKLVEHAVVGDDRMGHAGQIGNRGREGF